jgi:nicotinamidase-related amidase
MEGRAYRQPTKKIAPFFNQGTEGAEIHPKVLASAPDAPVVVKEYADSFFGTKLEETLSGLGVDELRMRYRPGFR